MSPTLLGYDDLKYEISSRLYYNFKMRGVSLGLQLRDVVPTASVEPFTVNQEWNSKSHLVMSNVFQDSS